MAGESVGSKQNRILIASRKSCFANTHSGFQLTGMHESQLFDPGSCISSILLAWMSSILLLNNFNFESQYDFLDFMIVLAACTRRCPGGKIFIAIFLLFFIKGTDDQRREV